MPTATTFRSIGYFPYDVVGAIPAIDPSVPPGPWDDGMWLGPYLVGPAMSIYWNLSELTMSASGDRATVTGCVNISPPEPHERVAEFPNFQTNGSQTYIRVKFVNDMGHDGSYYFFRAAIDYYWPPDGGLWRVTNYPDPIGPDWTVEASFTGSVFGASVAFYRQKFPGAGTYGGTDSVSITGAYYTYP